ncbi:MAG: hypothetical protein IPL39_16335 [Opitutaceae bacterium]|nr:hypothetical protein [Opitutaceae bacterium]
MLSLAHFAYAGEKAPFTARICETLRIESSLYPGTAEFDSKALASLQAMGERPKILETLFARGDRCDESFSLRAVHSHVFGMEGSEGDQIIYVTCKLG